jgi:hypothetical protein
MKRWIGMVVLMLGLAQPVSAQKYKGDISLTLQGGLDLAAGTFSYNYGVAPDFGMQADYAVKDGTAFGVRAGFRDFGVDEGSLLGNVRVANFVAQGKQYFTPDARTGLYAVGGWGVFWYKDSKFDDLSDAVWGGLAGLGLSYEASDKVSFMLETTYNGFFANPDGISYFSFQVGATIGLRSE